MSSFSGYFASDEMLAGSSAAEVTQAPTDLFVQRRNAKAQAAAEYRASKKASRQQKQATVEEVKARYMEEVANAKINRKAEKKAAMNELKSTESERQRDIEERH